MKDFSIRKFYKFKFILLFFILSLIATTLTTRIEQILMHIFFTKYSSTTLHQCTPGRFEEKTNYQPRDSYNFDRHSQLVGYHRRPSNVRTEGANGWTRTWTHHHSSGPVRAVAVVVDRSLLGRGGNIWSSVGRFRGENLHFCVTASLFIQSLHGVAVTVG